MATALGHERGIRRAIATVCLSGTLEDKLDAVAAAAGFDGVEIFENDLIASSSTPGGSAQAMRRPRPVNRPVPAVPGFRHGAARPARRERAAGRAQVRSDGRARHRHHAGLLLGGCRRRRGSGSIADQFDELAEHACRRGFRIAYEALAWGRHVNTWSQSWDVVRRGDHPALGLCLDSFHVLSRAPEPKAISPIADIPGEKIFFLQLADAPLMSMDVLEACQAVKAAPPRNRRVLPWRPS